MKPINYMILALIFAAANALAFSRKPSQPTATASSTATSTASAVSPAVLAGPLPACAPLALEKSCPPVGANAAVDVSEPVTQRFLCAMRQLKVGTVIRYFEYPNETIAGKLPKPAELGLIRANGLKLLGVFQHNNSSPSTFTASRGSADAARSADLAKQWGAPKGAPLYFGVDFEPNSAQLKNVMTYAQNFASIARSSGYKVGVYGSGDALKMLKDAGLADFTWVSQSTGFSGTKAYTASKQWALLQGMPKDCGGINVDFDQAAASGFGSFQ